MIKLFLHNVADHTDAIIFKLFNSSSSVGKLKVITGKFEYLFNTQLFYG